MPAPAITSENWGDFLAVGRTGTLLGTSWKEPIERNRSFVHMFPVLNQDEVNDTFPPQSNILFD